RNSLIIPSSVTGSLTRSVDSCPAVKIPKKNTIHDCRWDTAVRNWLLHFAHKKCHLLRNGKKVKLQFLVTTHPSYNAQTFNYDCTLLKLSSPAIYNGYVAPIALIPWNIDLPGGTMCTTTGWGRTESGGGKKLLSTLLKLNTLTEQCKDYWGNRITNMMICAGASGSSSCQGDSGGPLVYDHNGNWILAGIVSCGTTNCNVWAPAIYSSVADASLY
uniref:Peptidase S1 domain-containing protein n=1 Tax=Callorhinchus milii TaxID=7868 RepID=A0A4W3K5Z0_CALMI